MSATCRIPDTIEVPPDEKLATTALENPTQEESERQGWWAYCFGREVESNPYADTGEINCPHAHWEAGWWDAADNDGG